MVDCNDFSCAKRAFKPTMDVDDAPVISLELFFM